MILAVEALDGDPGVYSARWAGANKDFTTAMQKIQTLLTGKSNRRAKFVTVLALCWPDGILQTYHGEVTGELVWPPRGTNGFGYDAMFVPDGYNQTFAEISSKAKNLHSHRAKACADLCREHQ